ncbi:hypothetical protein [Actinomadura sp. GTD37]|uniref:hypothetical protein n=1 Tax=Actinomadura sp. GTD37 TaxID=1778030 RepID=UPI0035BF675E
MAGDAARVRTVFVRLRRVAAGRAVQRLLVLGGLLIAGWLLGCAAQSASAQAAELPPPAAVFAKAPVLGQTVATVHERGEPVRQVVVRTVAEKAPQTVVHTASPQIEGVVGVSPATRRPDVASKPARAPAPKVHEQFHDRGVPGVAERASVGHLTRHAFKDPSMPAPARHGDHSAAGGLVVNGATAGFPNTVAWDPVPPRASIARASGALPPAVRTAADEPTFAPD